ncbi:MAG: 2-hydroxyacyl-CoA dehydratase [Nitrospinae bacterium]|nr:2-hydroxyacyl-CoA dehydratase [Nitrospinota bacterium]
MADTRFTEIFANRYARLKELKEQGKRIIGWVCIYVPEEILHAAGFLPIRILGSADETSIADAYLYSNNCSFGKNCLEDAFQGHYDSLDGMVTCNSCDVMRRFYDMWEIYLKTPFTHIMTVPCRGDESVVPGFRNELMRFKGKLEEAFSLEIQPEALRESIALYNRTRRLLRELWELRKADPPPLSGAEALEVILAGMVMPKEEFNPLLESYIGEVRARKASNGSAQKIRLLLTGPELADPGYVRFIEELGSVVAIDDLSCGTRYFWDLVEEAGDPWETLARRYATRQATCPRVHPQGQRIEHLKQLARDYKVEAVIDSIIKFCESHGGITPILKREFAELGLPMLHLEREYQMGSRGQLRTRVQAFFESLDRG